MTIMVDEYQTFPLQELLQSFKRANLFMSARQASISLPLADPHLSRQYDRSLPEMRDSASDPLA